MVNDKMFMRNHSLKTIASLLGLAALLGISQPAHAQREVTVIGWTNQTWRFNDTGAELGTLWRTNGYNDGVWAGSGTGLFGVETTPAVYGPVFNAITTPTTLVPTNLYLRTTFSYFASNFVSGMQLFATNLMDDGSVVYLNGVEVARFRVPANQNAAVYASAGPDFEGTNEVFTIATNLLRVGVNANVMAVEVHQAAAGSSDIVWGQTVVALVPSPVAITTQPQSSTNPAGATATFTVGISGGPVTTYTWQKETSPGVWGAPTPAAGNLPTYTIPNLTPTHSGNYRVIAASQFNSVTSSVAQLVVIPDTVGPVMRSAEPGSLGGVTNRILIRWSELLNSATATLTNNYTVRMFPATNIVIPVLSVLYSPLAGGTILNIDTNGQWFVCRSNYYITVNNVRDTAGNVVAPNSQVALGCASVTNVIPAFWNWSFNPNYAFGDPATDIPAWYTTNYVENGNWGVPSPAVFGYDSFNPVLVTCIGQEQTRVQVEASATGGRPVYFRTTFNWPFPAQVAELRLRSVIDDGLALYLNGNEIYRYNIPAAPTILNGDTRALSTVADGDCRTNTIPGTHTIRPGLNYLAAAVYQDNLTTGTEAGDLTFALELDTVAFIVGGLPTNPPPLINWTRSGGPNKTNMIASWSGYGWAWECTTNTATAKRGTTNYYVGPWDECQPMSNPMTNSPSDKIRIYRLRKAQVQ